MRDVEARGNTRLNCRQSKCRVVKPIVIIRFNPNADQDALRADLKSALQGAFSGNAVLGDDRGLNIYRDGLIGYGEKRRAMYEESPVTKRLKLL